MGQKDRWASGGPGMGDVATYWRMMREHHGAVVSVTGTLQFPDAAGSGLFLWKLTATPGPMPELYSGPLIARSVSGAWPSFSHRAFASFLYRLTFQLDHELGEKWWEQRELPF